MSQELPYDDAIARYKLAKVNPYWRQNMPLAKSKMSRFTYTKSDQIDKKQFSLAAQKFIIKDIKDVEYQKSLPPPSWIHRIHLNGGNTAGTVKK